MRRSIVAIVTGTFLFGGCVSHSKNVNPEYVSPSRYASLTCAQLEEERRYIGSAVARVADQQDDAADADAVLLGVGAILFWPALLAMPFNEDQAHELGRLKGEYEAVSRAQDQKGCLYSHMVNEDAPAVAPDAEADTTLVTASDETIDPAAGTTSELSAGASSEVSLTTD